MRPLFEVNKPRTEDDKVDILASSTHTEFQKDMRSKVHTHELLSATRTCPSYRIRHGTMTTETLLVSVIQ
jgi:hypothetical protein